MVCTFSPPGVSSAMANRRRASVRRAASGWIFEIRAMAVLSAVSSSAVQRRSSSNTRFAMLAAAALVKVMQRIFAGLTPSSRSRITRCASTWVLPEPALAATHAETAGSDASICTRMRSAGISRIARWIFIVYSLALCRIVRATGRPLLHASQMVIGAVAGFPHRQHQWPIRLFLVLEPCGDLGELFERAFCVRVCVPLLESDRPLFSGQLAAPERDVNEIADGGVRSDAGKSAAAQNGGFEGELRRDADAHLLLARHLAGLVVEDGIASVGAAFDAIGARAQGKHALAERDRDLAVDFGDQRGPVVAALAVPGGKPARDPLETRPPECTRLRVVLECGKVLGTDRDQLGGRIGGQPGRKRFREFAQRSMNDDTAVGGARREVDGVEFAQLEDMLGVDRVGIAQPILHIGDGKPGRARGARRLWRGPLDPLDLGRVIERAGPGEILRAARTRLRPRSLARDRRQSLDEARGHGRRAGELGGIGENHLSGAQRLSEVVRGE